MPASLEIGFFVLGAVLLLIALVGGKIKIFVAEVTPIVTSPFIRLIAFVLGVGFILLAIYPGMIANASAELTHSLQPTNAGNLQSSPQPIQPTQTNLPVVLTNTSAPPTPSPLPIQPTQIDLPVVPTNTPTPPKPSPTEFVVSYWKNVSDGNLERAWGQLSPRFRQAMHNDDYYDYVRGYQKMNLCHIMVSDLSLAQQENQFAVVTAHFTYYAGSHCNSSEYDFEMWLIYDGITNLYYFDKNIAR